MVPYVKFVRGSHSAFELLENKDPDTLYFISEPDSESGVLYLGDKLIADTIDASTGTLNLSDLKNVKISSSLADKDILIFDNGKWRNQAFSDIVNIPLFDGLAAGLVPVDEEHVENGFLSSSGNWQEAIIPATVGKYMESAILPSVVQDFNTVPKIIGEIQAVKAKVIQSTEVLTANITNLESDVFELKERLDWQKM